MLTVGDDRINIAMIQEAFDWIGLPKGASDGRLYIDTKAH